MKKDFLKELKFLGVTARLKRLSDVLAVSVKDLYRYQGIDIEPSWHLVFLKLKKDKISTMSELAEAFQLSQPAITKMLSRMLSKGYIKVCIDKYDSRKRLVSLSEKAINELPKFEKVWNAGQSSIKEILNSNKEFLLGLEKFEQEINNSSFCTRAIQKL